MVNRSPLTSEFATAHTAFAAGGFASGWTFTAKHLATLTDALGPHDSEMAWLEDVRIKSTQKNGVNGKVSEFEGLLIASGGYDPAKPADASKLDAAARNRVAALKLIRHLYMLRKSGGQQVWVLALSNSLDAWPSAAFATADLSRMKILLNDRKERFSSKDKKHLANASQEGMKYVQRAIMALTAAGGNDAAAAAAAQLLVKRWFAGNAATAAEVSTATATALAGFKKIQAILSGGRLLFTDHPEVRYATDPENISYRESYAFVKGAREGMDVIYIEDHFFKGGTLKGLKDWASTVVHELSHRELATEDHKYSDEVGGIAAGVGLTPADAITNADNWAFFAVDAAGQLTNSERQAALT